MPIGPLRSFLRTPQDEPVPPTDAIEQQRALIMEALGKRKEAMRATRTQAPLRPIPGAPEPYPAYPTRRAMSPYPEAPRMMPYPRRPQPQFIDLIPQALSAAGDVLSVQATGRPAGYLQNVMGMQEGRRQQAMEDMLAERFERQRMQDRDFQRSLAMRGEEREDIGFDFHRALAEQERAMAHKREMGQYEALRQTPEFERTMMERAEEQRRSEAYPGYLEQAARGLGQLEGQKLQREELDILRAGLEESKTRKGAEGIRGEALAKLGFKDVTGLEELEEKRLQLLSQELTPEQQKAIMDEYMRRKAMEEAIEARAGEDILSEKQGGKYPLAGIPLIGLSPPIAPVAIGTELARRWWKRRKIRKEEEEKMKAGGK